MRFNPSPEPVDGGYFLQCVDPGGDTGMALLYIKPDDFDLVDYKTVAYNPHRTEEMPTETLINWKLEYTGTHRLVYEDFHVRNTSAQKDTTALRVIGAIDQIIFDRRPYADVHAQEPVEAKRMVSDETLRTLGLDPSGGYAARHVRDALRHGVDYLTRHRYLPVCRLAYPRGGGAAKSATIPRPGSLRSDGSTPAR